METRACVLYAQEDVRVETREVGEVGPQQVLITHQSSPDRTLRIATDGVRPFSVDAVQ